MLAALVSGLIGAPWGIAIVIAALLTLPMVVRGRYAHRPGVLAIAPSVALTFLNASVFMLLSLATGRVIALLIS